MSNLPENAAAYRNPASSSSLLDLPGKLFTSIATLVRGWIESSHDRMRLLELDDHMLADIGMTRRDVERIINKPFWRV